MRRRRWRWKAANKSDEAALASEDGGTAQVRDDGGAVVSRGVGYGGDEHAAARCGDEQTVTVRGWRSFSSSSMEAETEGLELKTESSSMEDDRSNGYSTLI
ncbi:hypothetical protein U1Q18_003833 [Sarracenia purpurea var. burkii]